MRAIAGAGIGLRHPHDAILAAEPQGAPLRAAWLEVHSENYLCDGGPRLAMLEEIRARYPLSCHGVGLSLGSAEGLDQNHLARLKNLFARVEPALVSEHLSWSVHDGVYLNDLLPLPYTEESLAVVTRNVHAAQDAFGRRILVENPSRYVSFKESAMPEAEFLTQLVANTGCGLLLDVNNVYVSCVNTDGDPEDFIRALPAPSIGEIHLAGHSIAGEGETSVLVDTHSAPVCEAVWELYRLTLATIGPRPTLVEWDRDLPALEVLSAEAGRAQQFLETHA
jgi:uncharacterized protein (UPF0276 family)